MLWQQTTEGVSVSDEKIDQVTHHPQSVVVKGAAEQASTLPQISGALQCWACRFQPLTPLDRLGAGLWFESCGRWRRAVSLQTQCFKQLNQ